MNINLCNTFLYFLSNFYDMRYSNKDLNRTETSRCHGFYRQTPINHAFKDGA